MTPLSDHFAREVQVLHKCGPTVLEQLLLELIDAWGHGFHDDLRTRLKWHVIGQRDGDGR